MLNRSKQRRGAVAVEMAFALPLLFLFVLGSIEFGRMNVIRHTIDNAAYEAARRAIVPGSTQADAETVANSIMATVGAKGVNVVVTPPVILIDTPEVNVNVTVDCSANGFIAPIFFAGRQLVGNATLKREQL